MIKENYSKDLEHALNKRNEFQLLRAKEIQERNRISMEQANKFNFIKSNNIKPIPHNFERIKDGSFFK